LYHYLTEANWPTFLDHHEFSILKFSARAFASSEKQAESCRRDLIL